LKRRRCRVDARRGSRSSNILHQKTGDAALVILSRRYDGNGTGSPGHGSRNNPTATTSNGGSQDYDTTSLFVTAWLTATVMDRITWACRTILPATTKQPSQDYETYGYNKPLCDIGIMSCRNALPPRRASLDRATEQRRVCRVPCRRPGRIMSLTLTRKRNSPPAVPIGAMDDRVSWYCRDR
jgi:hypothetical protein